MTNPSRYQPCTIQGVIGYYDLKNHVFIDAHGVTSTVHFDGTKWVFSKSEQSKNSPMNTQVAGNHYSKLKIQPIEFITENNIPYIEGNVIKYVVRHRNKNGVEDLKKAMHYLQILIDQEENKKV